MQAVTIDYNLVLYILVCSRTHAGDGCVSEGEHVFWIQTHTEENLLYGRESEEEEDSEAIYPSL